MSLRDALVPVLARDSRYSWQGYVFIFEALEFAKARKRAQARPALRARSRSNDPYSHHVTGQELCLAARDLALDRYGLLALTVLAHWGIQSTSDLGEMVYHLIATGDLEKTPNDRRSDFDNVFNFETSLREGYELTLDETA